MLHSPREVIRSLTTYNDWCQPATASVIAVGTARRTRTQHDGLHPNLVDTMDERNELCRRFRLLPERDRLVLILWYLRERSADEIARELDISRRHCFRLRANAVRRIVRIGADEAAA
jgi:DNA-directed RNA polymerase specialized sigma subunit